MRILLAALPLMLISYIVFAADLPIRKAGLWEMTMEGMAGMPAMVMKQCTDAKTDERMQKWDPGQTDCKVGPISRSGDTITTDSVCKLDGTTATTRMVTSGDFQTAYTVQGKTTFSPPMQGMAESNMTIKGRFVGPCTPDLKPGDMVMPGGMKMNIDAMPGAPAR